MLGISWLVNLSFLCEISLRAYGFAYVLILIGQHALFPVLAVIDLEVKQVPTLLLRLGSGWTVLMLLVSHGFPSLVLAGISTALFIAPLAMSNWAKPGSIGSGDVRLGIYIGPILSIVNPIFASLVVLVISSVLALVAAFTLRLVLGLKVKRIPLVPFILGGVVTLQLVPSWLPIH